MRPAVTSISSPLPTTIALAHTNVVRSPKCMVQKLMVAAGTGNDFRFFPPGQSIIAIDTSPKMLERAAKKAAAYSGTIELRQMDVC